MAQKQTEPPKKPTKKLTDLNPTNASEKSAHDVKGGAGGGTTTIPKPPRR